MLNFLKKLLSYRDKSVTVILWDDNMPDEPTTHHFRPSWLYAFLWAITLVPVVSMVIFLRLTPVGVMLLNYEEYAFRQDLIRVSERLVALQDSLNVREAQMGGLKEAIRSRADTSFTVGAVRNYQSLTDFEQPRNSTIEVITTPEIVTLSGIEIRTSNLNPPTFPTLLPVSGIITARHNPSGEHAGIDIAAQIGDPVRVIADGVIVNVDWTVNFGTVAVVQHSGGYVSVYKHLSHKNYKSGDIVPKGDILSGISNSGLLSSGPHLHFELWHNGKPLDPMNLIIE